MAERVGDFFWRRLADWGVTTVFGYSGDGINGLLGALGRNDHGIRFIQARHEEMAAFMASAYAKFTGEVGVCLATSGPGGTHLITGMYDAYMDHVPLLAIVGQQPRTALGAHFQQEFSLVSMMQEVAGAYVQQASTPAQVRHLVDRAYRIAKGERRVTALVIPNDLQEEAYAEPEHKHGYTFSGVGYTAPRVFPQDVDLRRAADVLNAGKKVAILVGAGALHATDQVIAVAERLQAGVAKALLGKASPPDDLPYVTGTIGLLGTKPSSDMMAACDTLLMIGSGFPWAEFLPKEGQARGVQIDLAPGMLSLRYPMEVPLVGDAVETLNALLPLLQQKPVGGAWRRDIESGTATWWEDMGKRAMAGANPVNPQRVTWELSSRLPDRVIVTSDSGSCVNWFSRDLKMRRGMMCSLSGSLASMGSAVPYAFAAKMAYPDRPVVALVGDGAMQMNNMAELITVAKYMGEWSNKTWICCVWNNEDLNEVTWEQRVMEGNPRFASSQSIPNVPYHKFAELIGLKGIYVDDPDRMGAAWDEAFASPLPVVLEVKTDPDVPPLPPFLTLEQVRNYMTMLGKGDASARHVLADTARQVLSTVVPGMGPG